jgi:hypothetical protein
VHPPSIAKEAEIQDFTPLDDFNQSFLSFVGFKDNGESTDRVPFDMKSTLVTFKDMARYLLAEEKLRIFLKQMTWEDHQWQVRSLDQSSMGIVKV